MVLNWNSLSFMLRVAPCGTMYVVLGCFVSETKMLDPTPKRSNNNILECVRSTHGKVTAN